MNFSSFNALSGIPTVDLPPGLPAPGPYGWMGNPLLASWSEKVRRGEPVTVAEHNCTVAQLAWCRTVLAGSGPLQLPLELAPPSEGRNLTTQPVDLVLGGGAFQPFIPSPASSNTPVLGVIAQDAPPVPARPFSDADRQQWITVADGALAMLRLTPEQIVAAPPGAVVPGGFAFLAAVPPPVWLLVGRVAVAGIAAFAAYSWGRGASVQATERVRIQQNTAQAMRADHLRVAVEAQTALWAEERRRHAVSMTQPPRPVNLGPLPSVNTAPPPDAMAQAIEALKSGAVAVGGLAAGAIFLTALMGVGERALARREMRRTMGAL